MPLPWLCNSYTFCLVQFLAAVPIMFCRLGYLNLVKLRHFGLEGLRVGKSFVLELVFKAIIS